MASNLNYSNGTRNAQQQGLITYAGADAIVFIYSGAQPATANTAISGQTVLCQMAIGGAFGTDSNGTLTITTPISGTASASGTASFFRITKSNGATVVMDGSIGTTDADLILDTTTINNTQTVTISSGTIIRNNI
jgi:hypothetical protein